MNMTTLLTTAAFISCCYSGAAQATDTDKQVSDAAVPTQQVIKQQSTVSVSVEQVIAELKQDLANSIQTQVQTTLNSVADSVKNVL